MRRGRAKTTREITSFQQAPYGQKKNPFQPMSIFSEDEIESIHEASLKVLCDTGIDIQSPRAVEIMDRQIIAHDALEWDFINWREKGRKWKKMF